eukprot:NODE_6114_length_878_cov_232.766887_g5883_i0.p1 GENE.NODE_6114_length_878_cov_232.766887_g5883_i0~~NODE_6114_length_878_cov_232.766887_g5883_i0.p1  ORF type:complete len:225 (-),score=34.22 NODE_6114_length_878_cov_232.766887_g5883_i0:149-823(-)
MADGKLRYGMVGSGTTILAQGDVEGGGRLGQIVPQILKNIPRHDSRMSYVYESYLIHYIVENELVYLCIADEPFGRKVPFGFLEELKDKFCEAYAESGKKYPDVSQLSSCAGFKNTITQRMNYFNQNPGAVDKVLGVRKQVEEVKDVMIKNIDTVIARGEKLNTMVDKTDQLADSAHTFKKSSTKLKSTMRAKQIKLVVAVVLVVAVCLWLIISLICGFDFSKC